MRPNATVIARARSHAATCSRRSVEPVAAARTPATARATARWTVPAGPHRGGDGGGESESRGGEPGPPWDAGEQHPEDIEC
ncbi:hypothetical protein GCM10027294_07750 [Marinactinospora endophytica]